MSMYFDLSDYMNRIVLVSLYINHKDLRFLLFYDNYHFVSVCKWEGKINMWAIMLVTSNDCGCDTIWICYDCIVSIKYV
jgi:hypothetical protein